MLLVLRRCLSILLLLLAVLESKAQQDLQFSQYMFNGLQFNPAYAGYKDRLNINGLYRTQWTGYANAPKTMGFSLDRPFARNRMGLGFAVTSDKIGIQDALSASLIYAYKLELKENTKLSFGLGLSVYKNGLDPSLVTGSSQNDPLLGSERYTSIGPDINFGILYNSDRFYFGASASNLLSSYLNKAEQIPALPKRIAHYYVTSGLLLPLTDNIQLQPSFLFKSDLNHMSSVDLSAMTLLYNKLSLGASYRAGLNIVNNQADQEKVNGNAIVLITSIPLAKNLKLGYSYDYPLGELSALGASHEISLRYNLGDLGSSSPKSAKKERKAKPDKSVVVKKKEATMVKPKGISKKELKKRKKKAPRVRAVKQKRNKAGAGMVTPRYF